MRRCWETERTAQTGARAKRHGACQEDWRASSGTTDWLEFYVDGVLQPERLSGTVAEWCDHVRTLGAGAHPLQWRYSKDATGTSGLDTGWVDEVSFVADNLPAFADATEYTGDDLTTAGGGGVCSVQTAVTHDGTDALRTLVVGESGIESVVETTSNGPAFVSYSWKITTASFDYFEFYLDGVLQCGALAGNFDWRYVELFVPTGSHTLRWRLNRTSSLAAPLVSAFLDEVRIVPLASLPLAQTSWRRGRGGLS